MSESNVDLRKTEHDTCKECDSFDSYRTQRETLSHWHQWGWCGKYGKSVFENAICRDPKR